MAAYMDDNDDRNSSADSDFFSPISASFFRPKQPQQQHPKQQGSGEKLPPLHDSSWIGARLSPIGSFDNEEDDEDDRLTSAYHKALHESIEKADFIVANERTRLLRPPIAQSNLNHYRRHPVQQLNKSAIHPLWDQPPPSNQKSEALTLQSLGRTLFTWGSLVCTASGALLLAMAHHDFQQERRGDGDLESSSSSGNYSWSWWWIRPPKDTFILFGAFVPALIRQDLGEYLWRSASSAFLCSSVVEYAFVLGAWRLIGLMRIAPTANRRQVQPQPQPWHQWCGVYLASCLAGQLWMTAWDATEGAATGCVAWSTCGVLTHVGMQSMSRRMVFFLAAAWLLVLSLLQRPYSSVMGTVGASFFGWSLAVAELWTLPPPNSSTSAKARAHASNSMWVCWIGRVVALKIVILPTLFISFLF